MFPLSEKMVLLRTSSLFTKALYCLSSAKWGWGWSSTKDTLEKQTKKQIKICRNQSCCQEISTCCLTYNFCFLLLFFTLFLSSFLLLTQEIMKSSLCNLGNLWPLTYPKVSAFITSPFMELLGNAGKPQESLIIPVVIWACILLWIFCRIFSKAKYRVLAYFFIYIFILNILAIKNKHWIWLQFPHEKHLNPSHLITNCINIVILKLFFRWLDFYLLCFQCIRYIKIHTAAFFKFLLFFLF